MQVLVSNASSSVNVSWLSPAYVNGRIVDYVLQCTAWEGVSKHNQPNFCCRIDFRYVVWYHSFFAQFEKVRSSRGAGCAGGGSPVVLVQMAVAKQRAVEEIPESLAAPEGILFGYTGEALASLRYSAETSSIYNMIISRS